MMLHCSLKLASHSTCGSNELGCYGGAAGVRKQAKVLQEQGYLFLPTTQVQPSNVFAWALKYHLSYEWHTGDIWWGIFPIVVLTRQSDQAPPIS